MTSSRQRERPPAKGVHGGRGGGRGLVAGTIVAVPRGGPSRLNGPSPWEAPRRPFSLYNFNSRVDDFASWSGSASANTRSPFFHFPPFLPPFPSFFLSFFFCFLLLQPGHRCSRKQLPLRPPGCSKPIEQKITRVDSSALIATQSRPVSHPIGLH